MVKSFQKSAKRLRKLDVEHPGIMDPKFATYFDLNCYAPPQDLTPFVAYIWVQRPKMMTTDYTPLEIITGPSLHLFITKGGAFIHPLNVARYRYDTSNVTIGIKFRPGGMYPFVGRSLTEIIGQADDAQEVLPRLTNELCARLLKGDDASIVMTLFDMLQERRPVSTKNTQLVAAIMNDMASSNAPQSVSEIADRFNVAERTLQMIFATHVGVGLKWIVMRCRLLNAVEQISKGTIRGWAEMALSIGFSSQSHFTREFTRTIGISPSRYVKDFLDNESDGAA